MEATTRDTLLKLIDKIAEEQKYVDCKVKVKDMNSGGANITSALVLATISAEEKEDINLFAKVALLVENVRKTTPIACPFTTELYFYTTLLKLFEGLQEKNCVAQEHRLIFPKIYGANEEYLNEILVLENLMKQGYRTHDRLKSVDIEYASKAIELLAKFHALSLAYYEEEPENFEAILKKMTFDYTQDQDSLQMLKLKMLNSVYEVTADEYREKLEKFLEPEDGTDRFMDFLGVTHSKKPRLLVHGDFKPSNLMHRRLNGKLEIIPVDFQIVHNGSPIIDLAHFLFTGADEEFRKQHYHELLDLYYEELKLALERLHVDPGKVYPEEAYREELKETEMLGLMVGVILLPMVLVAEENVPSFGEEAKADIIVPASDLYRERFNGILKNYAEWGLL